MFERMCFKFACNINKRTISAFVQSRNISRMQNEGDMMLVKQRKKQYGRKEGCERCGRKRGIVRRYGLHLCRQCFRDTAESIGFKKYS